MRKIATFDIVLVIALVLVFALVSVAEVTSKITSATPKPYVPTTHDKEFVYSMENSKEAINSQLDLIKVAAVNDSYPFLEQSEMFRYQVAAADDSYHRLAQLSRSTSDLCGETISEISAFSVSPELQPIKNGYVAYLGMMRENLNHLANAADGRARGKSNYINRRFINERFDDTNDVVDKFLSETVPTPTPIPVTSSKSMPPPVDMNFVTDLVDANDDLTSLNKLIVEILITLNEIDHITYSGHEGYWYEQENNLVKLNQQRYDHCTEMLDKVATCQVTESIQPLKTECVHYLSGLRAGSLHYITAFGSYDDYSDPSIKTANDLIAYAVDHRVNMLILLDDFVAKIPESTPTPKLTPEPTTIATPSPTLVSTPTPIATPSPTPELTPIPEVELDSDSDGVSDKYDYAPNDPTVQTKEDTKTPGFGVILAISSLLAVAYLVRRRR